MAKKSWNAKSFNFSAIFLYFKSFLFHFFLFCLFPFRPKQSEIVTQTLTRLCFQSLRRVSLALTPPPPQFFSHNDYAIVVIVVVKFSSKKHGQPIAAATD